MAHIVNRTVSIRWKLDPNLFNIANKKVLGDDTRKFGSTIQGVNNMLSQPEMLQMLMPSLIGINHTDMGWQKAIATHWNDLQIDISQNGKKLNLSMSFELEDTTNDVRAKYIKILKTENKFKTNEELASYVMKNVRDEEKYKYGIIINPEDYLLFIYSKQYRDVANNIHDINKSPHIRFYIHDETLEKEDRDIKVNLKIDAHNKYLTIINSDNSDIMIKDMLYVIEPGLSSINETSSAKERQIRLFEIANSDSLLFLETAKDTSLVIKAHIHRLLNANILKKLINSDIIIDADDPAIVIGNTINEAVSWFSNDINKPKISEYNNKLKAI